MRGEGRFGPKPHESANRRGSIPPAERGGAAAKVLRSSATERESRGDGDTRNIIAIGLDGIDDSVIRPSGHVETPRRRARDKKQRITPADPIGASELGMPHSYAIMAGGRQFLQNDSDPVSADTPAGRLVVFATDRMLEVLANTDHVFADGNFSMAHRAFIQKYVFRALVGDRSVTSAYAFLSRRTRDAYENPLNAMVNRCAELVYGSALGL